MRRRVVSEMFLDTAVENNNQLMLFVLSTPDSENLSDLRKGNILELGGLILFPNIPDATTGVPSNGRGKLVGEVFAGALNDIEEDTDHSELLRLGAGVHEMNLKRIAHIVEPVLARRVEMELRELEGVAVKKNGIFRLRIIGCAAVFERGEFNSVAVIMNFEITGAGVLKLDRCLLESRGGDINRGLVGAGGTFAVGRVERVPKERTLKASVSPLRLALGTLVDACRCGRSQQKERVD
jgi:hypothetical protein